MKAVLKKVLGLSLVAMTSIAAAQSKFPDGPIKMIVPF
ncbi:MAG: tripartite tricarboxylate transporter substrate binding protein, partial [Betaproteobacteria bacterium]|nr:tripartite tricarboxylate transporter substrate binding protein [Betaproteobacteria bacterium]